MTRLLRIALIACLPLLPLLTSSACKKDEAPRADPGAPSATPPKAPLERGSKLLIGDWQAEEFIAASPSGSASAAALNAQIDSDKAQAVRVTYTGDQVKIIVEGQVLASSYWVRDDEAGKTTILNGKDVVIITFFDADHMIIDRPGNPFAAKMKMRRLPKAAPAAAASSGM